MNPIALLALAVLTNPAADSRADFSSVWHDGQAEVAGYRWSGTRYGQIRQGEAVAILVTEPFSLSEGVKADRPTPGGDTVGALKLNLVRDFQTGIYDYNTMVSCFLREDDLSLIRQTFTSAEWCGHVFESARVDGKKLDIDLDSYFQGESAELRLPYQGGLVGEQLFVWLRGLHGAPIGPGETADFAYLPEAFDRRMRHRSIAWETLRVTRDPAPRTVKLPAGSFSADTYRASCSDGRVLIAQVEAAAPYRLLSWAWSRSGEILDKGELTGSRRIRYWEEKAQGDESLRESIGLAPR